MIVKVIIITLHKNVPNRNVPNWTEEVGDFMSHKKMETGLIVIKQTKFDKIRRSLLMFFYGKDYEIIEHYEQLLRVNRPKNIVIPKEIKGL